MLLIQVPGTITDTTLPQPGIADPLLVGANGGVKVLFDLAAVSSWPSQAAPVNGDTVVDLSANGNLTASISGTAPTFAGGGWDFTTETAIPRVILAPSGVLSSIWAATNDYFLVCGYYKLPVRTDWNTTASLQPLFCATLGASGYTAEADLVTIAQVSSSGTPNGLTARRQNNGGSGNDSSLIQDAAMTSHYGKVAQVSFWRNASGQVLQVTTSAGTAQGTAAVGVNNTGDFSLKQPRWGRTASFSTVNPAVAANKSKLYRGFIEDLSVSGRDPATVLAADWTSVSSRFS